MTVAGQALFAAVVPPILRYRGGRDRINVIRRDFGLSETAFPHNALTVPSVNSEQTRESLHSARPEVIVVFGTRILAPETLTATSAPFINLHYGIAPRYRGVHGGYWALAEGRAELAGTTVHLIDRGIDTGEVIEQAPIQVDDDDSFVTYPYLHLATGLPLLKRAVHRALNGTLESRSNPLELSSKLRTHPTLFGYLSTWLTKGVR
jgi:folate-dependent phosphoribosylglycinamide formyltransferase PurN